MAITPAKTKQIGNNTSLINRGNNIILFGNNISHNKKKKKKKWHNISHKAITSAINIGNNNSLTKRIS